MYNHPLDRRQFLQLLGISGLSLLLSQCGLDPALTDMPGVTASPSQLPKATLAPTGTPTPTYRSHVAVGRADSYDVSMLRSQLQAMFDGLGGLGDLIRPGARVGIKPNLSGGTWSDPSLPAPPTELFVTHPAVVQALGELLLDAGAGQVYIMEGLGDLAIFPTWGYSDVAASLNAELVNLCSPAPYADFAAFPVGPGYRVYDLFYMNPLLGELDVFISVAKMKCHSTTGVTLAMKNLFGIPPIQLYRRSEEHNHRSAFHASTIYDPRVPRVIVDLNLVRPVHLALVDGVVTAEGGAGVWDAGFSQVRPGVLVAGRDPVATDAVAAALMGFEPDAPSGTQPFAYADNHLALARQAGLGTNRLADIGVVGTQIAEALHPFRTVR